MTTAIDEGLRGAVEAILFVVDTPVPAATLAELLDVEELTITDQLEALAAEYERQRRGFTLRPAGEGWRLYTREEYAEHVERYVTEGQRARLTQAALETLAVVAYRQPVTRGVVERIRGVDSDYIVRSLLHRRLIVEQGRADTPGRPILYGTSFEFLERFGLTSLDDLPSLEPEAALRLSE